MRLLSPIAIELFLRLRVQKEFLGAAIEIVEIAPRHSFEEPAAISLPNEVEKVVQARHFSNLADLKRALAGGTVEHPPTIMYRYKNAYLVNGSIFSSRARSRIAKRRRIFLDMTETPEYESGMMCADIGSDLFFGRWLRDGLAKELLADELNVTPINQCNSSRIHEGGYREILNLKAERPHAAFIRNLSVVDDRGYNLSHTTRFLELRRRARIFSSGERKKLIYISRGSSGETGRDLLNSVQIKEVLEKFSFETIYPERMEALDIVKSMSDARIVVSVEGSALAHAQLALPNGALMLTIQPSNRFNTAHMSVAQRAQIGFAYVVAEAKKEGLFLAPERLRKTLDLLFEIQGIRKY